MEHRHHSSTHNYLMWKLQSDEMKYCFRAAAPPPPPPYFQESLAWPPRSYSCSFCRREFRSAQALGGHMNVHRRDRAKLKQSPPPPPSHHQPQPTLMKPSDHEIIFMNYGNGEEVTQRRWEKQDETDFVENDVVCNCKRSCVSSTERCSSMEEIDLELRLGAPAVKVGRIS